MRRIRSRSLAVVTAVAVVLGVAAPSAPVNAAKAPPKLAPAFLDGTAVSLLTGTAVIAQPTDAVGKGRWTRTYSNGLPRYIVVLDWTTKRRSPGTGDSTKSASCTVAEKTKTRVTIQCLTKATKQTAPVLTTTSAFVQRRKLAVAVTSVYPLIDMTTFAPIPVTDQMRRDEIADAKAVRDAQVSAACAVKRACGKSR